MNKNFRFTTIYVVLGVMLMVVGPSHSATPTLGHWEIVHQVDYDNLPEENLMGDIGQAYLVYQVTLAGFHTDTYGITIGPDDDARYTTDGGQSWTKASSELYCRHGLEIVNEQIAWHCGNGGTRVSMDGGQNWTTVAPSSCPFMSFVDEQTGWTASPIRLQITTDGGMSWSNVSLPWSDTQGIAAIELRTATDGYILSTLGNLYSTTDGGQSWQERSLGLRPGEQLITTRTSGQYVAMRFWDTQHGMVVFSLSDRTVWYAVTEDGGQHWQRDEISELRDQSYYYHLFLSRDGPLLTVTDTFLNGQNVSIVLRYEG
jgi:photosystem II stability/assembly factor-like uncharacterized protein